MSYQIVAKLIFLVILGGGIILFLFRAVRVWCNSAHLTVSPFIRILWSLAGGIIPSLYWWKYRISVLTSEQRESLLRKETAALNLRSPDSMICPLCGSEIVGAWTVTENGGVTVSKGPISCPRCDFRLDSCRFCQHFLSGKPGRLGASGDGRIRYHLREMQYIQEGKAYRGNLRPLCCEKTERSGILLCERQPANNR